LQGGDRQGGDSPQDGDSGEAAEFGTLVHYLLEKAFAHVRKTGEMYIPPFSLLSHTSLPSHIRNDHALYEQACDIVHSLTRTELFRNIEDADDAYFELPFTLCLEAFSIHGKIDLFLVTGGRTMLIDYKSGRIVKPDDYRMQLDIYRLALEMMGWPEPEAIIYDLRQNEPHRLQRRFTKREITEIARELSGEPLTT
ncbi:MAG: PD-(D/E)XK nuclease family protein, partial [Salinispira sp.]